MLNTSLSATNSLNSLLSTYAGTKGVSATARNLAKSAVKDMDTSKLEEVRKALADSYKSGSYLQYTPIQSASSSQNYTPESANKAAAEGIPTHGFFYHNIDDLAKVAGDPEQTLDNSFAKDTLDFLTGGNYTQSALEQFQGQMTTALQELAKQVEDTGKVDSSKLQSTLDINGTKVTLSQLADFQMMGQKLAPAFDGISENSSRFEDMQATARMAVARLMGQNYAKTQGEAGKLFSQAIDGLYEKGMDRINQYYTDAQGNVSPSYAAQASETRDQVTGLFSGLDTTNKSTLAYDFNNKLSTFQSMLNQRDTQFGIPVGYRNATESAKTMGMYFNALYKMFG